MQVRTKVANLSRRASEGEKRMLQMGQMEVNNGGGMSVAVVLSSNTKFGNSVLAPSLSNGQ